MPEDNDATGDATDSEREDETEVNVGDRYRLADDGTVFEVVGVTAEEIDVVQYDDAGERQGEYTVSIEEFRREIVAPAQ
jgi:hypothetical protein